MSRNYKNDWKQQAAALNLQRKKSSEKNSISNTYPRKTQSVIIDSQKKQSLTQGLEKYNRNSRISNHSQRNSNFSTQGLPLFKMSPNNASIQFKKYLQDTKNVFYEDRPEAIALEIINKVKPISFMGFGILLLLLIPFYFITPYEGICPGNASCGVFINCHNGYELKDNKCYISQQARYEASNVCKAVISNLQQEFGNKQCEQMQVNINMAPSMKIYEILEKFEIESRATQTEIYTWFQNQTNQAYHKFIYDEDGVKPVTKTYSFLCSMELFSASPNFPFYCAALILTLVIVIVFIEHLKENHKASVIYEYLKGQLDKSSRNGIVIDYSSIRSKLGIKINGNLWGKVERLRFKQKKIVFYEDEELHWVKLE